MSASLAIAPSLKGCRKPAQGKLAPASAALGKSRDDASRPEMAAV